MALTKLMIASFFLYLLVVLQVQAIQTNQVSGNEVSDKKINCKTACAGRCKLSSRPNLCKRACGTCCARCNCVPPGTSGNYEACSCYNNLTTRGNRHKCP